MKNIIVKLTRLACCTLALGFASMALNSYAGPDRSLQRITTQAQASSLKPGSEVVMTCAKCKTVKIAHVDKKGGMLGWFQPKTKHECCGRLTISTSWLGTHRARCSRFLSPGFPIAGWIGCWADGALRRFSPPPVVLPFT